MIRLPHRPHRIALVSEHASPLAPPGGTDAGGQNIYVAHVARELAASGLQVDVFTRRDSAALAPSVTAGRGVQVHHVEAGPATALPKEALLPHMPAFRDSMRRHFLLHGKPDLLHANFFMSGWVGLALKREWGLPLVTTFHALGLVRREHQGSADSFPSERIAIERALVQQSDRTIAECPQDKSDLQRLYGAAPRRLALVPCGVDTTQFRPGDRLEARRKLGLAEGEFIVLQLGRLVPRKGIDNVIDALALLPAAVPARLVVVGGASSTPDPASTPEIGRLMALAQARGVGARVQFVGQRGRDELRDWYCAADVFVTTPWYEPFGITPLEAMACGRPVVGSAVGGIMHTVVHGITGFHVPPRHPASLAERLLALHAAPEQAAAMGRAGAARVRAHFTWSQVAAQLTQVYAEVLQGSVRPPLHEQPEAGALLHVVPAGRQMRPAAP